MEATLGWYARNTLVLGSVKCKGAEIEFIENGELWIMMVNRLRINTGVDILIVAQRVLCWEVMLC